MFFLISALIVHPAVHIIGYKCSLKCMQWCTYMLGKQVQSLVHPGGAHECLVTGVVPSASRWCTYMLGTQVQSLVHPGGAHTFLAHRCSL